jgi:hypothetical protein
MFKNPDLELYDDIYFKTGLDELAFHDLSYTTNIITVIYFQPV